MYEEILDILICLLTILSQALDSILYPNGVGGPTSGVKHEVTVSTTYFTLLYAILKAKSLGASHYIIPVIAPFPNVMLIQTPTRRSCIYVLFLVVATNLQYSTFI